MNEPGGILVLVHPEDMTPAMRFYASWYGVDIREDVAARRGQAYVIDLDRLADYEQPQFEQLFRRFERR